MPYHLLTIPAELRLKICKLALRDTTYVVEIWEQYEYHHDYFLEDYKSTGSSPEAQHTTSLLLVCHQLHVEVIPFFYDFIRLHLRSNTFVYRGELEKLTFLQRIDCTVLSRATQQVQTLSIPLELPHNPHWAFINPEELTTMLPRLKTLIVYDLNDVELVRSRNCSASIKQAKENLIYFLLDAYTRCYEGLHDLVFGAGRRYTVVHQEFLDDHLVCIGTLLVGATQFSFEFLPIHEAIVKLEDKKQHYLHALEEHGGDPVKTSDESMLAFKKQETASTKTTTWTRNGTSGRLERS